MRERLRKAWTWLRKKVLNKDMLFWFIIAELIFWFPCIVTAFLGIFYNPWYWTVFGAMCAFWAGPFTPAIPLQIGLAYLLKKVFTNKQEEVGPDDV